MKAQADELSIQTKAFVGVTASIGVVVLASALFHWQSQDPMRFACYLAVAILALQDRPLRERLKNLRDDQTKAVLQTEIKD